MHESVIVNSIVSPPLALIGQSKIKLYNFKASDLFNTGGMLDKQDPCLKVSLGSTSVTTKRFSMYSKF